MHGYWRFWWPLALVGLAMPLARMVTNGALARFPDGTTELAVFAYAQGTFFLPRAALVFLPQMANVLARSRADHRRCRSFAIVISIALTLPVVLLAGPLRPLLGRFYGIDGPVLAAAADYLLALAPLLLMDGLTGYTTGLLVRHRRTGAVSTATIANLATLLTVVLIGFHGGHGPLVTIIGALWAGGLVQLVILLVAWARTEADFAGGQAPPVDLRAILAFFWPLAITSMMFAASRPTAYAVIGKTEDALVTVAILRVAFDLGMLAQLPVNQFRHLVVTFLRDDPRGVARFMTRATAIITVLVTLVVATPLSQLVLGPALGVDPALHAPIRIAWAILIAVPAVVAWRNWHHGQTMVARTTRRMALAGVLRVCAIALICLAALALGLLDHRAGALAILLGFVVEGLMVRWMGARAGRRLATDQPPHACPGPATIQHAAFILSAG